VQVATKWSVGVNPITTNKQRGERSLGEKRQGTHDQKGRDGDFDFKKGNIKKVKLEGRAQPMKERKKSEEGEQRGRRRGNGKEIDRKRITKSVDAGMTTDRRKRERKRK